MMKIIKDTEFDELCKASYQKGEAIYYENDYEQSGEVPPQFGRAGHQFIKLRNGLDIQRYYGEFRQPLNLDREHTESIPLISKFYLSGSSRVLSPGFKGVKDDYEEISGHNYLYYLPDMREIEQWRLGQQIQVIMICMTLDCIKSFSQGLEPFPNKLQQLLEGKEVQRFHQPLGRTNRAMQQILHQILSCPYQGLIRQMYLEGKALELVAIQLAHWSEDEKKYNTVTVLRPDDIERLHQAKDILIHNLNSPPSLLDLARQVGLNDRKLKEGFLLVFGTTVFGYFQTHRMLQGKQLLAERSLSVAGVAHAVGYTSPSRFCDAFKRQFGITPKAYQIRLYS
ncbi:helix-turn-helix transcriptional regulator [Tolypothrix sp. VBCCA 56010]|uniref:AraC family transcriptional regulator n=1 Tax=Tolypothrix sp. VBCCA 56010 TaxID=3137731 RepID=UPI003D7D933B